MLVRFMYLCGYAIDRRPCGYIAQDDRPRPDSRPGPNADLLNYGRSDSDPRGGSNRNISRKIDSGADMYPIPQFAVMVYRGPGVDNHVFAQARPWPDYGPGSNHTARTNSNSLRHNRARMNYCCQSKSRRTGSTR